MFPIFFAPNFARRAVEEAIEPCADVEQTTVNLKKVELPVKQIVSGKIIKPSGTLLNPESLDFYYKFAKIEELVDPKSKL